MTKTLNRRAMIATTVATTLATLSSGAIAEPIGIAGFSNFARKQLTPVWCWAAVLETLLNYRGIQWTQTDIVNAIKGNLSIATATDLEISSFLNSWGFNYNGRPWRSKASFYLGSPSPELTVKEFRDKRPIILKFRISPQLDHVVIAYVANVVPNPGGPDQFMSLFYIDPADGEIHMMTGRDYVNKVVGHWLVDIWSA